MAKYISFYDRQNVRLRCQSESYIPQRILLIQMKTNQNDTILFI